MRFGKKTPVFRIVVHEPFFGKKNPHDLMIVRGFGEVLIVHNVTQHLEAIPLIDNIFHQVDKSDELYESIQTFPGKIGVGRHHGA